jgi:flavin-dependent dehydrogenase
MYTDGVLLAGDAAGLVDSFNGEGIRFAIASGRFAAETVISAHQRNDFTGHMLSTYQNRCFEYMGRDLQRAIRATDLCFRHPDLFFGTVVKNRDALSQYIRTITGEMSFSDYIAFIKQKMAWYLIKRYLFGR